MTDPEHVRQKRGRRDLLGAMWVAVVAVLCAILVTSSPWTWLEAIGAIPLFLVMPGIATLSSTKLSRLTIVAVPAISISVTTIIGLVLAVAHLYRPGLVVVIMVAVIVLIQGGATVAGSAPSFGSPITHIRRLRPASAASIFGTCSIVGAIVIIAITWSVQAANQDNSAARTLAVWAVPHGSVLTVGVSGGKGHEVLDIVVASKSATLARWQNVRIDHAAWTSRVSVPAAQSGAVTVTVSSQGHVVRVLDANGD